MRVNPWWTQVPTAARRKPAEGKPLGHPADPHAVGRQGVPGSATESPAVSPADIADARPHTHPRTLAGWVRFLQLAEIPVLRTTADAIEEMRQGQDDVDARMLAEEISADPLMTLKLLSVAGQMRRPRQMTDVETAREAVVWLGITPFFNTFGSQPTVEEHLLGQPEALAGLRAVLRRCHRAARFALGFAVHRGDPDAEVIHEAALLHDFAELLLWVHAPDLALDIQARQLADPTLRSAAVQRQVLGLTLAELQHELMLAWRLPELLVRITDDRHESASQVRNVLLAIRIARHTARGWENPAVPDDIRDVAQLLNMSEPPTQRLLLDLDGAN